MYFLFLFNQKTGYVMRISDWSSAVCSSDLDRLIPDIIRALGAGERPMIRNPASIRPWQHVLEALSGYLAIGTRLIEGRDDMATAWNFGPSDDDARPVSWIVERMLAAWGSPNGWEIGRASCRERVCQYVKISVVAVELKT